MKAQRNTDGSLHLEITEEDKALLAGATIVDIITALKEWAAINSSPTQPQSAHQVVAPAKSVRTNKLPEREWTYLTESLGERKGNHEHARYLLFQNKNTKAVTGLIKSKRQNRVHQLGNPDDPKSIISQIWRVVDSMSFHEPFTRSDLVDKLPSHLARSEYTKFSLQYLQHIRAIGEEKGKELGTSAKQYLRLKERGNSPSQELGNELAGAIPR